MIVYKLYRISLGRRMYTTYTMVVYNLYKLWINGFTWVVSKQHTTWYSKFRKKRVT